MVETTAAATPISSVVGVFPNEASLEDAAGRLNLAGFDRAALSRPPTHLPPEEATGPVGSEPAMTEADRRQARTLGTSLSGAAAGVAAAGVVIATGGAVAVAALAAAGAGGVAALATAAVQAGAEESRHEEADAAAELGQLTLAVSVSTPVQEAKAEAVMRAAGAAGIVAGETA